MDIDNLHLILRNLYTDMMPLCKDMIGVSKGIAGLGALFYVATRVWQALSRAEPIDVYPLLRPFAIGLCIMFFPTLVLGSINAVLSPVVKGTHQLLQSQTFDMVQYRAEKDRLEDEAMRRSVENEWLAQNEKYDEKLQDMGVVGPVLNNMFMLNGLNILQRAVRSILRFLLELLFEAAALVVDTIRTFFLVVLAILGPLAFAISVWDGFQGSLIQWLTRYITVYLWLPIADLFSAMLARLQVLMISSDIDRLHIPGFTPDLNSAAYIIFMVIGIIGYFTIPSVAKWIVSASMGNLGRNVNSLATKAASYAGGGAGAAAGNVAGRLVGK